MAVAVSLTMNITQAMKMNITFWTSPMPNAAKVSGIRAASGMLRPKIVSGSRKALGEREAARTGRPGESPRRGQEEAEEHAPQRDDQVAGQSPIEPELLEAPEGLPRARKHRRADDAALRLAGRHEGPEGQDEGDAGDTENDVQPGRDRSRAARRGAARASGPRGGGREATAATWGLSESVMPLAPTRLRRRRP